MEVTWVHFVIFGLFLLYVGMSWMAGRQAINDSCKLLGTVEALGVFVASFAFHAALFALLGGVFWLIVWLV